jgi:crossover junction endodeoxyribonuclease RusA
MKLVLPWPNRRLSPNARLHYMHKARVVREAREFAGWETLKQLPDAVRQSIAHGEDAIAVKIAFYPPDKRHRDDDNMLAMFKSYRDGIADGLKVNDRRFKPHYFFEEAEKPGRVEVIFGE